METTKAYIRQIWAYIGSIVLGWISLFGDRGDKLISYYCDSSFSFLGIPFYNQIHACPLLVSIGYISIVALFFFIIGLLFSVTTDIVRIKTEKIFRLDANKPIARLQTIPRWASITITNVSGEILRNCFVDLVDVLDKNGKSVLKIKRQRKLKWSAGDPPRNEDKEFQPEEQHVIDIAFTDIKRRQFILDTQGGEESNDSGEYEVIIAVRGELNGKPRKKRDSFILTYHKRNIITIRKKGDVEWKEIDPQPPEIKGKYPPVSMVSSS